ncbi:Apoptotic chromatin condensation inducer in the nucleus-like protein [Drosera capensis]
MQCRLISELLQSLMKPSTYPVLNNRPIDQWKVTELKEELKRRKLITRGLKEELVRRLDEAMRSENEVAEEKVNNGISDSHPATEHIVVESKPVVDEITGPGSESTITTDSQLANASIDHSNTEDGTLGETPTVDGNDGMPPLVEDPIQNEEALAGVQAEGNEVSVTTIPAEVVNGLSGNLSYEGSPGSPLFHFSGLEKEDKNSGAEQVLDDEKPSVKDEKLDLPDTAVQVSEVTTSLEFQVNHDSITSDPISVNEINDPKDDIADDDVKLELEAKPEMVQPLSDDVAPSGGELLSVEFEKQREDKVPVEQACSNTADIEMSERYTLAELGSPEKLNLDRRSGDDSMEEDASESKQLDSTYESVGEKSVETEMSVVKEESSVDAIHENLSVAKNNSVQGEKKDGFVAGTEKRKLPVDVIEPSKRQRRWNTAKNVKAVETDSVTALSLNITQDISQHSSTKSLSLSSSNSGQDTPKERIVPPPARSPTNSLRIDRFLRPFTLKAVQDLLAKTGTVTSFWMDQIKTHCYVTYSSEEEAVKTRDALYNLQWPPNGGRLLVAEFVEPDVVKPQFEPPVPQPRPPTKPIVTGPAAPVLPAKPSLAPPHIPAIKPLQPPAKPLLPLPPPPTLPNPPPARGLVSPRADAVPEKIDSPIVTLDDLFRKTKATPRIYYLPLTDEQVRSLPGVVVCKALLFREAFSGISPRVVRTQDKPFFFFCR